MLHVLDHTCFIAFPEVVLPTGEVAVLNALAAQLQAGELCYSGDVVDFVVVIAEGTAAGDWCLAHKGMRRITSAPFTPHWNAVTASLGELDGESSDWDAVVSTLAIVHMESSVGRSSCVVTENVLDTPERASIAELADAAGLDWLGFGEYLQSLGLGAHLR